MPDVAAPPERLHVGLPALLPGLGDVELNVLPSYQVVLLAVHVQLPGLPDLVVRVVGHAAAVLAGALPAAEGLGGAADHEEDGKHALGHKEGPGEPGCDAERHGPRPAHEVLAVQHDAARGGVHDEKLVRHGGAVEPPEGVGGGGVVDAARVGHCVDEDAAGRHGDAGLCIGVGPAREEGPDDGDHKVGALLQVGEHGAGDGRQHQDHPGAGEDGTEALGVLGHVLGEAVAPAVEDDDVRVRVAVMGCQPGS